jgi:hypothetical protein
MPDNQPQWTQLSECCWRRGNETIVRYGTNRGWRFEIWHGKEQGLGNFKTFEAAVESEDKS